MPSPTSKDIPDPALLTMPTGSILGQASTLSSTSTSSLCFPSRSIYSTLHQSRGTFYNVNWTTSFPCPKPSALFPLPLKKIHILCHIPSRSLILSSCLPPSIFTAFQPHWPSFHPSDRPRSPTSRSIHGALSPGLIHDWLLITIRISAQASSPRILPDDHF